MENRETRPEATDSSSSADPDYGPVIGRIRKSAVIATLALTAITWLVEGSRTALALFFSGTLIIMNFIWLEEILANTLRSSPDVNPLPVTLRIVLRFGLIAMSVIVTVGIARFEPVGVLIGFSVIVIGIVSEGFFSLWTALRKEKIERKAANRGNEPGHRD